VDFDLSQLHGLGGTAGALLILGWVARYVCITFLPRVVEALREHLAEERKRSRAYHRHTWKQLRKLVDGEGCRAKCPPPAPRIKVHDPKSDAGA
jgi:hypothetical protein